MVLGIRSKSRKSVSTEVHYIINVKEIKPWPPSQSLRSVQSVVLQWENGDQNSGSLASSAGDGKIQFNESFRLLVVMWREASKKSKHRENFQKNSMEFNLYDKTAPKSQLLGSATINFADFGIIKETKAISTQLSCKKSSRNSTQPYLYVTIQPFETECSSSSPNSTLSKEFSLKEGSESVSQSVNDDDDLEIASFTDDDNDVVPSNTFRSVRSSPETTGDNTKISQGGTKGSNGELATHLEYTTSSLLSNMDDGASTQFKDIKSPSSSTVLSPDMGNATSDRPSLPKISEESVKVADASSKTLESVQKFPGENITEDDMVKAKISASYISSSTQPNFERSAQSQVTQEDNINQEDSRKDQIYNKDSPEELNSASNTVVLEDNENMDDRRRKGKKQFVMKNELSENDLVNDISDNDSRGKGKLNNAAPVLSKRSHRYPTNILMNVKAEDVRTENFPLQSAESYVKFSQSQTLDQAEDINTLNDVHNCISSHEDISVNDIFPNNKTELKAEVEPNDKTELKAEVEPNDKTELKAEVEPNDKTELKAEVEPNDKTELKAEVEPNDKTELKAEVEPNDKTELKAEVEPNDKTELKAEVEPNDKTELKAEVEPNDKTELKAKVEPNDKTELKAEVEMLKEELREAAALEVSLYSVIAEHGSSSNKVHAPARRLSRFYFHTCRVGSPATIASAAKSAVSGFVLVSKACGNDVPRLTFWFSNLILLRAIVSKGIEEIHLGNDPRINREGDANNLPCHEKEKENTKEKNHSWEDPETFLVALEKVEAWIFSRIVESVWWQTLTPYMQSAAAKSSSSRKIYGKRYAIGDPDQVSFSVDLWERAFKDACERLCPLRAGGHECGCLPVIARLMMEQLVNRLDVAMFNAILRDSDEDMPTDPISDPISDSKVLPIPAGKSGFGAGVQLKNAIGNWTRWLSDLFGTDDSDSHEDSNENEKPKCESAFKPFQLLHALSDLMMLPFEMLADESLRKEVCPRFGVSLIKRVVNNFVPDEFSPGPVPDAVIEALNDEEDDEGSITSFPCTADSTFYAPPLASLVVTMPQEVGNRNSLRSGSFVQKKLYTSDDELDELDSPLSALGMDDSSSKKKFSVAKGGRKVLRYELLRQVWRSTE
ncbi:PREDICTED: uncharacterized protein LOC109336104 isoform X2 [Lupinus angustifolius]|uniref:uncharacterized protein LOC109336104 isoform X2 n=1 Tax=Lupinus angustifolius TaxID=3871 RepID=UPI00092F7D4C|nr:PREDICTED: uncharacterized protein LOC109336104 isoform X2 [Lupinus angustifolius]